MWKRRAADSATQNNHRAQAGKKGIFAGSDKGILRDAARPWSGNETAVTRKTRTVVNGKSPGVETTRAASNRGKARLPRTVRAPASIPLKTGRTKKKRNKSGGSCKHQPKADQSGVDHEKVHSVQKNGANRGGTPGHLAVHPRGGNPVRSSIH